MATVGITQDLIRRIERKIEGMRMAERRSDLPNIDEDSSTDASILFNTGCWGAEHLHLVDCIPKSWLTKVDDARITIMGWIEGDNIQLRTSLRFNGLAYAYHRPKAGYHNKSDSELTIDEVRALPEDMAGRAELLQRWDDAVIEMAINAKWARVKTDVTAFLGKCKSLNEAVKLFPGIRLYLDSEAIERLERKVERPAQRANIVESVDTEGLTAAAIAAKLALTA